MNLDFTKIGMYEVDDRMSIEVSNDVDCAIYNAFFHYSQADDMGKKVYSWDYMRGILNTDMKDHDFCELMGLLQEDNNTQIAYACTYRDTYDTEGDYLIVAFVNQYKFTIYAFDMFYYTDTTLSVYEADEPETEADMWSRLCE